MLKLLCSRFPPCSAPLILILLINLGLEAPISDTVNHCLCLCESSFCVVDIWSSEELLKSDPRVLLSFMKQIRVGHLSSAKRTRSLKRGQCHWATVSGPRGAKCQPETWKQFRNEGSQWFSGQCNLWFLLKRT